MAAKKVVVVGLGRIGLPSAVCFVQAGFEVLGVDVNEGKLRDLEQGEVHPFEPGLKEVVAKSIRSGRLRLSTTPETGDAFILCLPSPLDGNHSCDLTYLGAALDTVAKVLRPGNLLVIETTVPVHTTRDFVIPRLRSAGVDVGSVLVAHAPERITSGKMLEEIRKGDRIIGGVNKEAAEAARDLYRRFVEGEVVLTDASTAELVKLIENTYRDVNIAFANEIALFCDKEGLNAWEAIALANRHPRVNIHTPGPGVGGHCIPVVPYFLAQGTKHSTMILSAREVNDSMPRYIANLILREVADLERPKVALMGVAYKPNASDPINSPALQIRAFLEKERVELLLCDPLIQESELHLVDLAQALTSDCLAFLVAHDVFKHLKPTKPVKGRGTVIDAVNCLSPEVWASRGWTVKGFARGRH